MRTETIKIYTLDELTTEQQEKAHEKYINSRNFEYAWTSENSDTLKAFENIFPVKVKNWSYDSQSYDVTFEFTGEEEIQELTGLRLRTYIINNYYHSLYKPKFINKLKNNAERVWHNRIRAEFFKTSGNWFNGYYSAISKDNSCVLTGYFMDYEILKPIYDFLKNPDSRDFNELMDDCLTAWGKACRDECQFQLSFEYFKDMCEGNDYEFTDDGEMV